MDDLDLYLRDEEGSLGEVEEDSLSRVSALVRESLEGSELEGELNYQQFLHLEVRIDKNRQKILNCNLGLTECIAAINSINVQSEQRKTGWQQMRGFLEVCKKVLTIRQVQLTMIFFILEYRNKEGFRELYSKNFGEVMEFMIRQEDCHCKINTFMLDDLFKRELEYLSAYADSITYLKHLVGLEEEGLEVRKAISRIKIANSKMRTISEIFPYACIKDTEDLFSVNQLHPRWQRLIKQEIVVYVNLSDKFTLEKSFQDFRQNLNVINAAMSIMDRQKWEKSQTLNEKVKIFYRNSIQILKCALSKQEAKFQAEVMISQGKDDLAKEIWNLPENRKFREFIQICLPSITHSQLYYLPRVYRQYFYQQINTVDKIDLPQLEIGDYQQYREGLQVKKGYEESIRVRINCNIKLQFRREVPKKGFFEWVPKMFKGSEKVPRALIFHIHGGGFISMSSFIHQTYTRIWANNLAVPIVSVDYGKAPSRTFPQGLYDCFEAYMWTLHHFAKVFQAEPQQVILVGDSAGGNLVAALTTLLIKWGIRKPSGIVLVYPALNLNLANYTPSLLTALNDMILPHTFLKVCAKSYLGAYQKEADSNQLISPILSEDYIMAQYPHTEIFVGNKDPFHDDCCRFIERLSLLNKKENRLTIFDEFPHGFLQFDLKLMPNEYTRQATKLVEKALERLLH